ncbi:hypothetical protein Tco_1211702 [Tanacetum coccineum]
MQAWDKLFEIKHAQPEDTQDLLIKLVEDVRSISEEFAEFINIPTGNLSPSSYDDDDDEESSIPLKDIIMSELPPCVAITPALYTDEPVDSLIIEDEHLDTIPETESDEFIKSSVENLVHDPLSRRVNGRVIDDESSYEEDVHEMSFKTYSNPLFDLDKEIISIELNPIHNEDLDSTPKDVRFDAESYLLESLEEIDIFFGPEDSIPPGIESDDFDSEDDDNSAFPSEFESFHVDYPNPGDSTIIVVEDIPMDVPNLFLTHPALHLDFGFIPSHNNLGSNLDDSSPSGDRNKTYDPGICIEVESMKSLAAHSSVIDTSLPFSSENEVKVFNHDDLSTEEKSPQSSSHCDSKAFQLSSDSPMLILGANTPHLSVRQVHFYPP